jgi:hypothetical protein
LNANSKAGSKAHKSPEIYHTTHRPTFRTMKSFVIALSLLAASLAAAGGNIDNEVAPEFDEFEADEHEIQVEEINQASRSLITNQRRGTWRIQHNNMRKKYHVEYGGRFKALRWNTALELEAQAWAEEIAKTCQNKAPGSGQNVHNFGVNSAVRGGSRKFQSPINVMKTWESKLDYGYPINQVMTQVLWSGKLWLCLSVFVS